MYEKMRENLWWPSMLQDIVNYVTVCPDCQVSKSRQMKAEVQMMNIPFRPWSHVAVDHVGPLPITIKGNSHILVAICRFTKYVEAFAVTTTDTETTADMIVKGVICRHGVMQYLQSDRGSGFVSTLALQIYTLLGISKIQTTAYHPQSNGVVEIFNKTLKITLKLWGHENQDDWDELLPFVIFAYNTSYHTGLQEVPFYLEHGRTASVNNNDIRDRLTVEQLTTHNYATQLVQKLSQTHARVIELLQQVNEDRMNNNLESEQKYNTGDLVLLHDPTTSVGKSKKLVNRWKGPYTVVSTPSKVNCVIDKKGKQQTVHINRLRPFKGTYADSDEKYENEMSLAHTEIQELSDRIVVLTERKEEIERQQSKIEASKQAEVVDCVCIATSEKRKW